MFFLLFAATVSAIGLSHMKQSSYVAIGTANSYNPNATASTANSSSATAHTANVTNATTALNSNSTSANASPIMDEDRAKKEWASIYDWYGGEHDLISCYGVMLRVGPEYDTPANYAKLEKLF